MKSFQVKIPRIKGAASEPAVVSGHSQFKKESHAPEDERRENKPREPLLDSTNNRSKQQVEPSQKSRKRQGKDTGEVTAEERQAAEKLDGRAIIAYMETLGGTLDEIAGEDDRTVKGRRGSGHKERAVTPLKEKLLKSWGGSYLDRLDVVVGGNGQEGQATDSAPVFKPLFMQPPCAPPPLPEQPQVNSKARSLKKEPTLDMGKPEAKRQNQASVSEKKEKAAGEVKGLTHGYEGSTVARSKSSKSGAANKAAPSPSVIMPPPPPPAWVSSVAVVDGKAGVSTGKKRGRAEGAGNQAEDHTEELKAKITKLEGQVMSLKRDRKEVEDQIKEKDIELQRALGRVAELEREAKGMVKRTREAQKGAEEAKRAIDTIVRSLDA